MVISILLYFHMILFYYTYLKSHFFKYLNIINFFAEYNQIYIN